MKISLLSMTLMVMTFFFINGQAQALDITNIIDGTVRIITPHSIKIVGDSDSRQVQIGIDSNTVYDNVQKLGDLKGGDKVQVEYQTTHNRNIAVTVKKMESSNE